MTRRMPPQKPGRSRQCYVTPDDFMFAVEERFGNIYFDLAATEKNAKATRFFTRRQNALEQLWAGKVAKVAFPSGYTFWLNPPYANIDPWLDKCTLEQPFLHGTGKILVLVPASVGSNWFTDYVLHKASIYFLKGRLCFIRNKPYPKDLMLLAYRNPALPTPAFVWDWKNNYMYKF